MPVLLVGQPGTGKTTAIRAFMAERNCRAEPKYRPFESGQDATKCACFTCTKIWTKDERTQTQDILTLNGTDKVDVLRDSLSEWIGSLPKELDARYLILRNVHLFSKATLDTVLKLLEEPPEYLTVFLTTTDPESSPPAIQSRTFIVKHDPLEAQQLERIVRATPTLIAYTRFLGKAQFTSVKQLALFGRLELEKAFLALFVNATQAASLEKLAKQLWKDLGEDPDFPAPDARAFAVDYFVRQIRWFLRANDTVEGKSALQVQYLHQTIYSMYDSFLSNVNNPRASAYISLEHQWVGFVLALFTARKVAEIGPGGTK
ncbi:hypothetical protein CCP3SC15_3010002 [Gammaproteobacteria bacterium]